MAVMEGWLDLLVHQPLQHQPHHAQIHPRLAGGRQKFIVAAHPAVPADPGDRPLNNPAAWEHLEPRLPQRWFLVGPQPLAAPALSLDELQAPAERLSHPGLQWPEVGAVGPDQFQARQRVYKRQQEPWGWGTGAVLHVGGKDHDTQHQAEGVNEQVAFAPGELLGARILVAVRATTLDGLDVGDVAHRVVAALVAARSFAD
ncbi:MAG TPA: hypothetical protein VFU88_10370 [Ktedonobacterales bacterium]|nr:hypothetical protein [Ktedonobacterales bacterium]